MTQKYVIRATVLAAVSLTAIGDRHLQEAKPCHLALQMGNDDGQALPCSRLVLNAVGLILNDLGIRAERQNEQQWHKEPSDWGGGPHALVPD